MPLANKVRPKELDDIVGQKHILGKGKVLRRLIESGNIQNLIFYGPPGTGKTSVAHIIASKTNKTFYKINGISTNTEEIRSIISKTETLDGVNGILLYIDEIHHLSKKVQELILDVIERGDVTLIGSTSENPFFTINKAVLSRSIIYEFKPVTSNDIKECLDRIIDRYEKKIVCEDGVLKYISDMTSGDVRSAINVLDVAISVAEENENGELFIKLQDVIDSSIVKIMDYDKKGDSHYNSLSAFQKSMRGSDVDASLHYLARLIKAGDMQGIIRRLLCVASEDCGLASNVCVSVNALCDTSLKLGFPEARLPLAHATILCATSPKSFSVTQAIGKAMNDLDNISIGDIPSHLKDSHYKSAKKLGRGVEYLFPHDYVNNYVEQQYLPDNIKNAVYYVPGNNKYEKALESYWGQIKNKQLS